MKHKSLEKILAENMLRFGTKNLGDTVNKLKRLVEGLGAGDGVGAGVQIPADVLTMIQQVAPKSTAYKNGVTQLKNMKIPILCNGNIIDALIYGAIKGNAATWGGGQLLKLLGAKNKFAQKMSELLDMMAEDAFAFVDSSNGTISFNPDPNDPSKVATMGEVTPAMGVGGVEETGSDYNDLLTYLNTFNLMNVVSEQKWSVGGINQFIIDAVSENETTYKSMYPNGYLSLAANESIRSYSFCMFYATAQAGKGRAGKTVSNTKFIPVAGDTQKIPIPKDTFPKGSVIVADAGFKAITDSLTGFQQDDKFGKAGWKITGITVNTAASLGEKVTADINQFSTMTGVSVADLAKAGITATNVKDPAGLSAGPAQQGRSGQDFLAITRANNIKAKIEAAVPGITVTTNPQLATGGAEGRFGEVTFTVQGPNKEITIPAEMVSTGTASQAQDLSKVFNCYRIESDFSLDDLFNLKGLKSNAYYNVDQDTQISGQ
jgi:hypothetical protein